MKKILILLLMLTSCACRPTVYTESCMNEKVIPTSFPCGSSFYVEDTKCNGVAQKIEQSLLRQGYFLSSEENADYIISFEYGTDQEIKNKIEPFYLPGGEVAPFGHGTSYGCSQGFSDWDFSENSYDPGEVVFVPVVVTEYTKWFCLKVMAKNETKEEVWKGVTYENSANCNLNESLPLLVAASLNTFGK